MARVLRAPLLHFLVIGALLLGLRAWWEPASVPRARIVIGAADLARLREEGTEDHGAPPRGAAEGTLVRDAIDEEVLYREALARGFARREAAGRERLVRLGGFVGGEAGGSRDVLEREARRLGLERSDLVVRRHLVEMMQLAAGWLGPDDRPSEADLETYLARHAEELAQPARTRLVHVYLSEQARGAAAASDALALLGELRGAGPEAAVGRGDAFIRGAEADGTRADLERIFGPGFAAALSAAPLRTWVGRGIDCRPVADCRPSPLRTLPSPLVAGRDDAGVRLHVRNLVAALPDEDIEVRDVAVAVGQQGRARAIRVDGVGPRVGTVDNLAIIARRDDAGHVAGAIVGLLPGPGEGLMLAGVALNGVPVERVDVLSPEGFQGEALLRTGRAREPPGGARRAYADCEAESS